MVCSSNPHLWIYVPATPAKVSSPRSREIFSAQSHGQLGEQAWQVLLGGILGYVTSIKWVTTAVGFSGCFMDFSDDPKMVGFHKHSQMF